MADIFLETTAVIELAFWDKRTVAKAIESLPKNAIRLTSRYVLYELARGFLRNLILLHNKSRQVTGFSELQVYAGNARFAQHRLGTIIGAFSAFFSDDRTFPAASEEELLSHFQGFIRRQIRRGWRQACKLADDVINPVDCREDLKEPFLDKDGLYDQVLKKELCGFNANCGLKQYYDRNRKDFERLRAVLEPAADAETAARRKALRELYRHPKLDFDAPDCYRCGDATIAHEAPKNSRILTKNGKHFVPIGTVFGKIIQAY